MRAGSSTIQQTLTSEAATVLTHSIAEASRRNHGQTTPLHVAATLLASPSGFLRQACIRSHPNSSHPLQCRALELCFSVALERLPTAQAAEPEPPISNALMAALKRAQAHQRRGCPEQQQQPLLAVKVELEQLVISILDDPSVSRVMREASFSSPAVKAAIEQSLNASISNTQPLHPNVNLGPGFGAIAQRTGQLIPPLLSTSGQSTPPLANRNVYLNPRLQQGATVPMGKPTGDEVKKLLEIMTRSKKRNPVLVGDSLPEDVVKELKLESEPNFKNVQIISLEKGLLLSDEDRMASKMEELGGVIGSRMKNGGVILDLGDLKWVVEQPAPGQMQKQPVVSEIGRAVVVEMTKLLARFGGGGDESSSGNKLWLIGTATTETYLRCKVYHPTMENDWDLEAVPITSKSPLPGMFPRLGSERILSNALESLSPLKAVPSLSKNALESLSPLKAVPSLSNALESLSPLKAVPSSLPTLTRLISGNSDPAQKPTFCPQCSDNYEKELTKLTAIATSFSQAKQDAAKPSLPQWLQNAKLNESQGNDQGLLPKQKTQELHKKWKDTCLHLHPNFHRNSTGPPPLSLPTLYNPTLLSRPPFTPKLHTTKPLGAALQLNTNQVKTDLVLGRQAQDRTTEGDHAKDLLGCISSEPQPKLLEKFADSSDADTYKKLLKGLMEKAWWQAEAASAVASAITRCRLGNGKRRGAGSRGDVWLLFTGPDRVGKRKMASVLADQICGTTPIIIPLPERKDDGDSDTNIRGKRAVDRIAEAIRRDPFLVIVLEDIDEADAVVRGSIKRAIERGRLTDSYGREVGLGNTVFVVTGDWSTVSDEALRDERFVDERKLASVASGSWQLGLIVREKMAKRRASWLREDDEVRPLIRPRKEIGSALSLDLNLSTAYGEEDDHDRMDGSHNSSDLTVDHEDELGTRHFSITSVPHDLVSNVDDSIVFRPVDSAFVRREIKKTIAVKFSMVVDENLSIEVGDDVLQKILGGLWHDRISLGEWVENVLSPGFDQLKTRLPSGDRSGSVVRLVVESDSGSRGKSTGNVDWLPSSILV